MKYMSFISGLRNLLSLHLSCSTSHLSFKDDSRIFLSAAEPSRPLSQSCSTTYIESFKKARILASESKCYPMAVAGHYI